MRCCLNWSVLLLSQAGWGSWLYATVQGRCSLRAEQLQGIMRGQETAVGNMGAVGVACLACLLQGRKYREFQLLRVSGS